MLLLYDGMVANIYFLKAGAVGLSLLGEAVSAFTRPGR